MLITFGTPHRGSLNAVDFLVNGFVKKLGPLKVADLSTLLRSLTSVYQLLPIYPCVDVGNGHERVAEVDLPHVDRARAAAALHDFHRAIEAGAAAHDVGDYAIHSVVGIAQGTKQSARLDGDRLVMVERYGDDDMGGDGTVPRVLGDADRDRRPAPGVPADVLVRAARLAAARRGGADPAARHPHGPPAAGVPRRSGPCGSTPTTSLATGESARASGPARRRRPDPAGDAVTDLATVAGRSPSRCCAATPTRSTPSRSRRCRPATTASASTASTTSAPLADPVHALV